MRLAAKVLNLIRPNLLPVASRRSPVARQSRNLLLAGLLLGTPAISSCAHQQTTPADRLLISDALEQAEHEQQRTLIYSCPDSTTITVPAPAPTPTPNQPVPPPETDPAEPE